MRRVAAVILVLLALAAASVGVFAVYDSRGLTSTVTGSATPSPAETPEVAQVAVVQMKWSVPEYYSREAFEAKIEHYLQMVQEAADPGLPMLVVFPEYVGTPSIFQGAQKALAGATKLEGAIEAMVKSHMPSVLLNKVRYGVGWAQAVGLSQAKVVGQTYIETFSAAAARYGYYIIAGSAVLPDFSYDSQGMLVYRVSGGKLYNIAYFFGPDGKIIGTQKKVYLTEFESEVWLGLTAGRVEDLKVFNPPFGKIGIAVCLDAFKEPVVEKLISLGPDILVQPSANYGPWNEWQQNDWLRSSHAMVQEYPQLRLALNPMMTGPLFDLVYEGQSAICAPAAVAATPMNYSLLPPIPGFLMIARSNTEEQVLYMVIGR